MGTEPIIVRMIYTFINGESRNYHDSKFVTPIDDVVSLVTNARPSETTFWGKISHDEESAICTLHREDGPALVTFNGKVFFFIEGKQVSIEELPCEDMIKTFLKLKYGNANVKDYYFPLYMEPHMDVEYNFT